MKVFSAFPALVFLGVVHGVGQDESLESFWEKMDQIVTEVSSFTAEHVQESPSSVTVFSREQIQQLGVRTVRELLNFVPGFIVTEEVVNGSNHAIQPRGRYTRDLSNDVLILVDGLRINDSHIGGASIFSRLMTLGNVDQVEVIRGPGSSMYGSNAFQGVVNIVTLKQPGEWSMGLRSHQGWEVQAAYTVSVGTGSFSFFAGAFQDEGMLHHFPAVDSGKEVRDPRQGEDLYLRLDQDLWSVRLRYQRRQVDDFVQFNHVSPDSFNDSKEWSIQPQVQLFKNQNWEVVGEMSYMAHRWNAAGVFLREGWETGRGPLPADFLGGPHYLNSDFETKVQANWTPRAGTVFVFGGFYRETDNRRAEAFSNYDDMVPLPENYLGELVLMAPTQLAGIKKGRNIAGGFLLWRQDATERLRLFLGGRFDHYSDFGSTTNPRLGVVYHTKAHTLKFHYGSAFRAPSLAELYLDSPRNHANPNLKPETVDSLELSYVFKDHRAFFALTGFYNEFQDLIRFVGRDILTAENVGREKTEGAELAWGKGFFQYEIGGNFTFIHKGAGPSAYTRHGSLWLNWWSNWGHFTFSGVYAGGLDALPDYRQFWYANAGSRFTLSSKWDLSIGAKNVLNREIVYYGHSFLENNHQVPARGREWYAFLGFKP